MITARVYSASLLGGGGGGEAQKLCRLGMPGNGSIKQWNCPSVGWAKLSRSLLCTPKVECLRKTCPKGMTSPAKVISAPLPTPPASGAHSFRASKGQFGLDASISSKAKCIHAFFVLWRLLGISRRCEVLLPPGNYLHWACCLGQGCGRSGRAP